MSDARAERRDAAQDSRGMEARPRHDEIATRAYELFQSRGRTEGHDRDDWFAAERQLSSERQMRPR